MYYLGDFVIGLTIKALVLKRAETTVGLKRAETKIGIGDRHTKRLHTCKDKVTS